MKNSRFLVVVTVLWALSLIATPSFAGETVFQMSTIGALLHGVYDGELTFADLAKHGDFGLGTLNGLDGEMIALDGRFYQIKADGKVYPVAGAAHTPFALVTFFKPDRALPLDKPMNYGELEKFLEGLLPTKNLLYAFKIDGIFASVKVRSVPRQSQPYPGLVAATKQQKVFELRQVKGTMVGFRFPDYLKGVNVAGYHFHFISADRTAGGHVLDCRVEKAEVALDSLAGLDLKLPKNAEFSGVDLSRDRQEEVNKAEK